MRLIYCLSVLLLTCIPLLLPAQFGLHVDSTLTVLFGGDTSGAGAKTFWMPEKAAFRSGYVGRYYLDGGSVYPGDPTNWDVDSVGLFSIATGLNSKATGLGGTAMGNHNSASGSGSVAAGSQNSAEGSASIALGIRNRTSGTGSVALGSGCNATGLYSIALGDENVSQGWFSLATGSRTEANGDASASFGALSIANGEYSSAMGLRSIANGYSTTVVGILNDPLVDIQENLEPFTPMFIVGNGTGLGLDERKNALIVRYDGKIAVGTINPQARFHVNQVPADSCLACNVAIKGTIEAMDDESPWYGGYFIGNGMNAKGIYAETTGTGSAANAILARGNGGSSFAGYFDGNVHVAGTLSKSMGTFKIDHPLDPENQYLSHSFVESPDMMNVYNGNIRTDSTGKAVVILPDYFEALNIDFRYQLTVIGSFSRAMISKEVQNNQFEITTEEPNIKVSWQITGIRNDAYAHQHRVRVEEDKGANQGKYLNPEAFGLPAEMGINRE